MTDMPDNPKQNTKRNSINLNRSVKRAVLLSYKGHKNNRTKKLENGFLMRFFFGVPKGIRTPDLSLRRRTLYPTELLAHNITIVYDGLRFVKKLGNFLILLNIQKN